MSCEIVICEKQRAGVKRVCDVDIHMDIDVNIIIQSYFFRIFLPLTLRDIVQWGGISYNEILSMRDTI